MATSPTMAAATETVRTLISSSFSLEAVVRCRYLSNAAAWTLRDANVS
ncbi:hypothetical protein [Paenarthrobacter sp. YIM B13468]